MFDSLLEQSSQLSDDLSDGSGGIDRETNSRNLRDLTLGHGRNLRDIDWELGKVERSNVNVDESSEKRNDGLDGGNDFLLIDGDGGALGGGEGRDDWDCGDGRDGWDCGDCGDGRDSRDVDIDLDEVGEERDHLGDNGGELRLVDGDGTLGGELDGDVGGDVDREVKTINNLSDLLWESDAGKRRKSESITLDWKLGELNRELLRHLGELDLRKLGNRWDAGEVVGWH